VDFRTASYTTAEQELKRALELDPALSAARITLINVDIQQQNWQNALDNADAFLLENPASPYRQQVMATRSSVVRRLQPAP
jgi:tetratricopeptide (TPR) repeat protein